MFLFAHLVIDDKLINEIWKFANFYRKNIVPPAQGQNLNQQTIQTNSQRPNSSVMDPSNLAQQSTNTMGFPNNFYSNVGQFSYQGNIHSLKVN